MSLISPDQSVWIWLCLLFVSWLGMYGERIGWFRRISGALMTILSAAILVTIGVLPSAADPDISTPVYDLIFAYFIPFSIPLLLFNVQLKKMIRETGNLLWPFLIGAGGVVLGAMIASMVLDLGGEAHKVAGTFIGTYTGGSVNFMAVATALDFVDSPLFASTITVDNVFTNFYIVLLFLLPGVQWLVKQFPDYEETEIATEEQTLKPETISWMEQLTVCLLIAAGIYVIAYAIGPILAGWMGTEIKLEILLITLLIIAAVNILPNFFARYQAVAFDIGMFAMYMFLAVIGASSNLVELFTAVPGILLFATITLVVHLLVSLLAGKLLHISLKEILVASCANAGGPSVAAPMAVSFGMKKAVSPAILIGLLGYVIGTFLGVGTGVFLQ